MTHRTALITGITGQDGSYLAELLLSKGYAVHGIVRRSSNVATSRIDHLCCKDSEFADRFELHYGDLTDESSLRRTLELTEPDEVYHLAAQSHVRDSFDMPLATADITGMGTLRLLESVREFKDSCGRDVRFYQASSSEMFGGIQRSPQNEQTPFHPRSPYGVSKVFAYWSVVNYRESYGLHASNGILFNHESPRRGETFVTRKITRAAARIKLGLQDRLELGNIEARRDWGYAGDYVDAMWRMLQQDAPGDYVIATGEAHSVRDLLTFAFGHLNLDYQDFVKTAQKYYRPAEVDCVVGDASRAREALGWQPRVSFRELIQMMVETDLELARRELAAQSNTDGATMPHRRAA
ncbi:MAG: GDP-mannose 4,6-dehydratase [Planctomycetaceae bacterium]|nr:GDP-mannose 4,6-dehydratase [Planctomycetaceae bacterium]